MSAVEELVKNMSLVDRLTQKQAPKFQINSLKDVKVNKMKEIFSEHDEGILNLDSSIDKADAEFLLGYLKVIGGYNFELNHTGVQNYEIMFEKKKGVKN
jgi:hypothetical protein